MASDPWEDEAKNFKAAPAPSGAPAATSAPNEDWKVWQSQGTSEAQPGLIQRGQAAFDSAITPALHSKDQGIMGNIGTGALNIGKGALSLATPLVHPLQSIGATPFKNPAHPIEGFAGPDPLTEMGKGIAAHPIESAEQFGGQMLGGAGIGMAGRGIANMTDPIRAYRSPLIPENEAIARAATDIIKPNPLEYRKMVGNLTEQLPQAKEFLQRSGINRPTSPLEFGKGATGAGKEASGFFQKNLIEPNADAPAGSGTVGSVYARVSEINDKLRPMYRSQTMGEQLTKEAADRMQELESERDKLNGVMYDAISKRSGLPLDQVKSINHRGAQLQSVGDVTDAAQSVRRMGMNFAPGGGLSRMGILERIGRGGENLLGGPERIAGWRLGRIMNRVNEPPTPLPSAEGITNNRLNFQAQEGDVAASNRQGAAARKPEGLGPTQPPGPPLAINPNPELLQRSIRTTGRNEGIQNQAAADRAENLVRSQREQELLAKARGQQQAARRKAQ